MKRIQRIAIAVTSVLVALLVPAKSSAQSGPVIVMTCSQGGGGRAVITLDLNARTASEEWTFPGPQFPIHESYPNGTVTQIGDDKIVFITAPGTSNEATNTLNRYTGDDTYTFADGRSTITMQCLRQQKQF
jgi:uncharacterized protein YfaQ (DUF2300 family)